DFLVFTGGMTVNDIKLTPDGQSDDLKIKLLHSSGNPTADTLLIKGEFEGLGANPHAFGHALKSHDRLAHVAPNQLQKFIFDDGTSLDFIQITQQVIANQKTDGDDAIYGFVNDNTLDGGAGNDYLSGVAGADTYVFGRGYGHDVVEDNDQSSKFFGDPY